MLTLALYRPAEISIHAPREGSDRAGGARTVLSGISIHAPREGSDQGWCECEAKQLAFQSTLPARGATIKKLTDERDIYISIHAPREGSDGQQAFNYEDGGISIHAPREGSDQSTVRKLQGV